MICVHCCSRYPSRICNTSPISATTSCFSRKTLLLFFEFCGHYLISERALKVGRLLSAYERPSVPDFQQSCRKCNPPLYSGTQKLAVLRQRGRGKSQRGYLQYCGDGQGQQSFSQRLSARAAGDAARMGCSSAPREY